MKPTHWFTRSNSVRSYLRLATAGTLISAAAAMAFVAAKTSTSTSHEKTSASHFKRLHRELFETSLGKLSQSGEPEGSRIHNGRAQEAYDNRAYPRKWIEAAQQLTAANAATAISNLAPATPANWTEIGPSGVSADALVASESTGATAGTIFSGRGTAIAVAPSCIPSSCTVFIGTAGGGVWKTTNALASSPTWTPSSNGIASNAIGSLAFDASGNIYAGTGEPNGSGDSEAGVGLYKSTNGGSSWSLVAGSTAVATGRSVGAIAIDPVNASHIFI